MAFRCLLLHGSSGAKRKCWEACGSAVRGLSASSRLAAIKTLRDKTGAPISDIKASLEAVGFDQGLPHVIWGGGTTKWQCNALVCLCSMCGYVMYGC